MKKSLLSLITGLFCISVIAQNSINLKMNPEKNKVYRFAFASEQTTTQTINGNQQTTESKSGYTVSIKMIDATADLMILETHFDTLRTNTNTMGKTSVMSSDREGDIKSTEMTDVISCIMNRLCKNAVYVKMDYTGKAVEIVNSKMLSDIILKDTSSIMLTGQVASAVKTQISNLISDNELKNQIEAITWHLPGRQVAVGENWNLTAKTISGGMSLDIVTKYHLDGINGNVANITAESSIKASDNAAPIQSGGATVTYDNLTGMSKSNMVIDVRTGLIIEDKGKTHIAGTLGISAPGFSMQMPMDINGETKVTGLQ